MLDTRPKEDKGIKTNFKNSVLPSTAGLSALGVIGTAE
jgi:hypothetical protein